MAISVQQRGHRKHYGSLLLQQNIEQLLTCSVLVDLLCAKLSNKLVLPLYRFFLRSTSNFHKQTNYRMSWMASKPSGVFHSVLVLLMAAIFWSLQQWTGLTIITGRDGIQWYCKVLLITHIALWILMLDGLVVCMMLMCSLNLLYTET